MAGRTVLEWTLAAFQAHPAIGAIVLVANAEELARLRTASASFTKVMAVVEGGATRALSVLNGLNALPGDVEFVLVHDAARPCLSVGLIDRVLEATVRVGAAVPGLPLSDTVKRVDGAGLIRATVPRSATLDGETLSGLTAVQTPQGARVALLKTAYAHFDFAHQEPTDEASLIEALGQPVAVVSGDPFNIKITHQSDLSLAAALGASLFASPSLSEEMVPTASSASAFPETRVGFGYDVHAFADPSAGRKLFLGGVEIPHDRGLEGHSDADVLLHAICDALLGAASLGDIGILFPNTDMAYKGIASLRLLEAVNERLRAAGWSVVNIDATVVAEAPKLMPHREAMQRTMATSLGIDAERVSVKATTSEKMGFVGRREGMAAWATATVRQR